MKRTYFANASLDRAPVRRRANPASRHQCVCGSTQKHFVSHHLIRRPVTRVGFCLSPHAHVDPSLGHATHAPANPSRGHETHAHANPTRGHETHAHANPPLGHETHACRPTTRARDARTSQPTTRARNASTSQPNTQAPNARKQRRVLHGSRRITPKRAFESDSRRDTA